MQITNTPIDELIPYARNSRTHSDEQVAQIAASIREFGFTNPVLIDAEGGIIAGHGRVLAARKLDLHNVPCIVLAHLTDIQKRAYIIADNRLALNSGWDEELLKIEIIDLQDTSYDLSLLGFTQDDITKILDAVAFEPGTQDNQGKLDELDPKWICCPKCGSEFDARQA